jgi:hypothetical protein
MNLSKSTKVIIAVVLLALAGVVLAWQFGAFGSAPKPVSEMTHPVRSGGMQVPSTK